MKSYELTVVLAGGVTAAKKKSAQKKIEKMISALKGKTGKVEDWGEKELAYSMAKSNTGIFLHFPLELDPESAKVVNSKLNLEEDIIRYLLVRKE